jgi:hypothetical protein
VSIGSAVGALAFALLLALIPIVLVLILKRRVPGNPALAIFLAFVCGPWGHLYWPRPAASVVGVFVVYLVARAWLQAVPGWLVAIGLGVVSGLVMVWRVRRPGAVGS